MKPQTIKDEKETTISIEAEEIELDLELLEEVIVPGIEPCYRR